MDIKLASTKDIKDLILLNSFVQQIHFDKYPTHFKPVESVQREASGFFEYLINAKNNYLFIALKDKKSVGYIWFTLDDIKENPFKRARKQLYIHQIVVHNQHRHQSVGKLLMSQTNKIAQQNDISHIEIDSWSFNNEAHEFFKKFGFETYNLKMWRETN